MDSYKFQTSQLGISENGLHLLRSGYNYETLSFNDVRSLSIEKGRQVNNWMLLLGFGIGLFCFGFFYGIKVIYEYFFADNIHRFYIEQFVFPVLPLFIGAFSIYMSLKRGPVMIVKTNNKVKRFPLGKLNGALPLETLVSFLEGNELIKNRLHIGLRPGNV